MATNKIVQEFGVVDGLQGAQDLQEEDTGTKALKPIPSGTAPFEKR